ncbi:MAG TPA: DUF3667 domain-containing protein [Thermoanaerobaculia bacterium]|jgi:hypothetical protein|nr:DUF3667 domain-containing protein [Thermoanaerobaculia bacterium]
MAAEATTSCTNCASPLVDVYCAKCGEKQPSHHDLTVGHFAHELVHELVHLDSKLFRTLRDLVTKPGKLTAEYFAGRKKRSIAPIRLFLTLFAITFIAYSAFKPVAVYSLEGLMSLDKTHQFDDLLHKAAAKRHISYEKLSSEIEHRWQKNMSLLSMVSIVALALLLKLLYIRHRRYLTEHLVFSTHYICFTYLVSLASWPIYYAIGMQESPGRRVMMVVTFLISSVYLFVALRRVYGQGGAKTLVKSIVVWAGTLVTGMLLMTLSLLAAIFQILGV